MEGTGNSTEDRGHYVPAGGIPAAGQKMGPRASAQALRHYDVEKRTIDLQYARTQIVDQFEEYFVFGQRRQWLDEVSRIEGDGYLFAPVIDRQVFTSFSDLWRVGCDGEVVAADSELDRVGLVAGHDLGPVSGGKELLARQGDALLGFAGDDLPIIGIVALNQLGNDLY